MGVSLFFSEIYAVKLLDFWAQVLTGKKIYDIIIIEKFVRKIENENPLKG